MVSPSLPAEPLKERAAGEEPNAILFAVLLENAEYVFGDLFPFAPASYVYACTFRVFELLPFVVTAFIVDAILCLICSMLVQF